MDYQFKDIEQKWQKFWAENQTFKAEDKSTKPKYYVMDMFPYPSGAGLHVGHPLGYIASDIFARYKRLKGFNVLHPMGYDSFGLPAEQYAIQTGQHPAITTEANIATYRRQLDQIGFSFDWSREVRTSSPDFYKWTQWIFMQLFNSWYNKDADKAESIEKLVSHFEQNGSAGINAVCDDDILSFTADEWKGMSNQAQQEELLKYRLTYLRESTVNWCPALGTVLANDEVKDGFSERGGYPVEQKKMMQWSMRITAYADRLLKGLDTIDWPEPLKEMQRNWIGKSVGASVRFKLENSSDFIEVFTTRADTIFGATFLVLAPEHELVPLLTTDAQKADIDAYVAQAKKKSELERMAEAKTVSGAFTGSYAINPVNGEKIPVWIADYVLAGYGTGAVMAVPSGDQRDYLFAKRFELPIIQIIDIQKIETEADPTKEGKYINSDFINGLNYKEATAAVIAKLEEIGAGKAKINFRMRDAIFGRQRYWGEPVPVYFKDGLPYLIDEKDLPLVLPEVDKYLPTEDGEPPLARAKGWNYKPHTPPVAPSKSPPAGETLAAEAGSNFSEDEKLPDYLTGAYRETADAYIYEQLRDFSRENRKNPTHAENILWQLLRGSQIGHKIRRQHAIDAYIGDFVSLQKGLVIELDGHHHKLNKEADDIRTGVLNHFGFTVIRFSNDEVLENPQKVASVIKQKLDEMPERDLSKLSDTFPKRAVQVSPTGGDLEGASDDVEYSYELSTMPGWAGSSWYWFRYMDAHNDKEFASREAIGYWKDVDLYIGGSEHATGHLLYSRFWNKFLKDLGLVIEEEPFKKLINQGMIQGRSNFVYRLMDDEGRPINTFVSHGLIKQYKTSPLHVDVNIVDNEVLNVNKFKQWRPEYADAEFILENGKYICGVEVEKMSKSKYNVVNPDDLIDRVGADTLRMYEMFLGPLEQSKPWNTNGIEGVFKFLRKFWRLFHDADWNFKVSDAEPTKAELKSLHKIIRKVEEDIERFSFNTSVSSFMIAVNELTDLKSNNRAILSDMVIILSPYAPHICEELWVLLGNKPGSLSHTPYPQFNPDYLVEDEFAYPVSINGKTKLNLNISLSLEGADVEAFVLGSADVQKYLEGKTPKKVIVVKGRIVNIVV
ncbi:class I tRNA ligase family protein [Mucilaginibacter sp. L3T2-6]|uniref:leucine--tRNA ligase n=1 Tax=Mucilaginibacter sp. L3T2-6 TaxID=3062491 RepID=UPI002677369C|nr:class I tRNA ligase family protein [Mucilaginibacter sp. L3T2-6]MDO3642643.1 class I tRNA ligase family protein [Mucilaginibacter sp. L3T2-6]MDV6214961.1 class I tRNA ligase family protein [Mucilaginibacter sp. L3T2-6]